jgi:hypothetical protein
MIRSLEELTEEIAIAERNQDLARLQELQKYFRQKQEPAPLPFMPAVELNKEAFAEPLSPQESEAAIPIANGLSRAMRRLQYRMNRNSG